MSGQPPPAVDPGEFRAAMGRWATGVSVLTARNGEHDAGLTVNALLSVSLQPPSVLASLQRDADALPVLRASGRFAISLLAAAQREVSDRFARAAPASEKFRGAPVHRGVTGAALIDGALASLECRLVSATELFDHVLVVGEVVRIERGADGLPLVFYRGQYSTAEGEERVRLPRRPSPP